MPAAHLVPIRSFAMIEPPDRPRDPLGWTFLLTLLFTLAVGARLIIPSTPYFDEVHYLPAARAILALSHHTNPEHPPLAKELIALGIALFGDGPLGWRIMSLLAGALTLFSFMRALWFARFSCFASLAGGVLLICAFPLIVQSRIAMLDIFMVAFVMLAMWMCAAVLREPPRAHRKIRWRLAVAGIALGFAMAAKWNAIPIAPLPGIAFLILRLREKKLFSQPLFPATSKPLSGSSLASISLAEASLWLGALPLAAYALSYWPVFFYTHDAISPGGLIALHHRMLSLQQELLDPHTYQSIWYQWIIDWRAIWYLYEEIDGAQRGVLLVGNPVPMLLGLPALGWCLYAGLLQRRPDTLAIAVLYTASLGLWIIAAKNVQFYYHYFLPSCFLVAALALALDELWRKKCRTLPIIILAASAALLLYFWPILTAAPLAAHDSFKWWAWLDSWR